jgi:hypothetical protein
MFSIIVIILKIDIIWYHSRNSDLPTQNIWIGIAVGVFIAGIGIGYGILQSTNTMNSMMMNDPQHMEKMMSDPKTMEQFHSMMMNDQQHMEKMMSDPQHIEKMTEVMRNNPQMRNSLMNSMMSDPEYMKSWMSSPEHMEQMEKIMLENHDFMMQMSQVIINNQELRLQMMGHMTENPEMLEQLKNMMGHAHMDSRLMSPQSLCQKYGGNWLEEFNECESISLEQCSIMNGTFKECESACRHIPDAEICTKQCVQVCVIP